LSEIPQVGAAPAPTGFEGLLDGLPAPSVRPGALDLSLNAQQLRANPGLNPAGPPEQRAGPGARRLPGISHQHRNLRHARSRPI